MYMITKTCILKNNAGIIVLFFVESSIEIPICLYGISQSENR